MTGMESGSKAQEIHGGPIAELPVKAESAEATSLRSADGKARLELAAATQESTDLRVFEAHRSQDGMRSAHEVMDAAEAAGAQAPNELRASIASHPEVVDLLRYEPASVGFWRERAVNRGDRQGDAGGDAPPGGGAEDLEEALDVARRMSEDSEGRAEVGGFEPPESWIGEINAPGADWPGRSENCVFCGLATEMRWRGEPVQAGRWPHQSGVTFETADTLIGPLKETSASEIERALRDAGPGASGVVVIDQMFNEGHVVNVVNDRGGVQWLDGQVGTVDDVPPRHAVGYLWSARDRDGRPL